MPAGSAWPMLQTCMQRQAEATASWPVGLWVGPDRLKHDHKPGEIVSIGRPYESPNLVLWNGTRHQVVLTLLEE